MEGSIATDRHWTSPWEAGGRRKQNSDSDISEVSEWGSGRERVMRKGKGKGTDERWVRTILQKPEAVSSIALNLCSKVLAYHIDLVGEEWIQCLQQKPESQNVPQTDYFTEQKEGKVLHPQPMRGPSSGRHTPHVAQELPAEHTSHQQRGPWR